MWTTDQWHKSKNVISSFFAYIIKLLTKSDMATNDTDIDKNGQEQQNEPNRGCYVPQQEGADAY